MKTQTIQIAITAIQEWEKGIIVAEGVKSSPQFFYDTKVALKELKKELKFHLS